MTAEIERRAREIYERPEHRDPNLTWGELWDHHKLDFYEMANQEHHQDAQ